MSTPVNKTIICLQWILFAEEKVKWHVKAELGELGIVVKEKDKLSLLLMNQVQVFEVPSELTDSDEFIARIAKLTKELTSPPPSNSAFGRMLLLMPFKSFESFLDHGGDMNASVLVVRPLVESASIETAAVAYASMIAQIVDDATGMNTETTRSTLSQNIDKEKVRNALIASKLISEDEDLDSLQSTHAPMQESFPYYLRFTDAILGNIHTTNTVTADTLSFLVEFFKPRTAKSTSADPDEALAVVPVTTTTVHQRLAHLLNESTQKNRTPVTEQQLLDFAALLERTMKMGTWAQRKRVVSEALQLYLLLLVLVATADYMERDQDLEHVVAQLVFIHQAGASPTSLLTTVSRLK
jgi:hypothetical protein